MVDGPGVDFASSDAGVAGREALAAAICHAGMLGLGASVAPDAVEAAGTRGASKALAAMLISDSPCGVCDAGAKGEVGRPAEEAMADGEANGLFLAMRSVRRDLSSAWSSCRDEACACACLSIIWQTWIS